MKLVIQYQILMCEHTNRQHILVDLNNLIFCPLTNMKHHCMAVYSAKPNGPRYESQ